MFPLPPGLLPADRGETAPGGRPHPPHLPPLPLLPHHPARPRPPHLPPGQQRLPEPGPGEADHHLERGGAGVRGDGVAPQPEPPQGRGEPAEIPGPALPFSPQLRGPARPELPGLHAGHGVLPAVGLTQGQAASPQVPRW